MHCYFVSWVVSRFQVDGDMIFDVDQPLSARNLREVKVEVAKALRPEYPTIEPLDVRIVSIFELAYEEERNKNVQAQA